jgi:phospholipid/cholesterol/gamma-HCH transport system substrate-binding protein
VKTRPSYFSDYLIALVVIACTVVLLGALAMTLTGFRLGKATRVLHLDFPDVAGIHQHSQVRYAGAPAGAVVSVRHLTAEERLRSVNSANAVRVTVALGDDVPPIPADVTAALGADTLLSEKFIGLSAGTAGGPLLADGAVLQGIAQPTFDDLVRGGADVFATLNKMMPEVKARMDELLPKLAAISDAGGKVADDAKALFAKASTLMDNLVALSNSGKALIDGDAKKLMGHANVVADDAKDLIGRANKLLKDHEADLNKALDQLPEVLDHLDNLLGRTQGMLTSNEKELNATIRDLRVVMQDMRVTSVHAKKVMATLAGGRPSRLVWVKDDEPQPTDAEILRAQGKPVTAPPPSRTSPKSSPGKR